MLAKVVLYWMPFLSQSSLYLGPGNSSEYAGLHTIEKLGSSSVTSILINDGHAQTSAAAMARGSQ